MKNVYIPINGQRIKGTLFFPPKLKDKNPGILFVHGWSTSEKSYIKRAESVASLGYICLTISLRGHDSSDGNLSDYSRNDHLNDVAAAYDFLADQTHVDSNLISACGASYGGYLVSMLSSKRAIHTLVLRAPALYLNTEFTTPTASLLQEREEEYFQNMKPENNNFALNGIRNVKSILLIESEFDQIIPHNIIEFYKNAITDKTKLKHTVMKGADHQLSKEEWKEKFIEILKSWFKNQDSSLRSE